MTKPIVAFRNFANVPKKLNQDFSAIPKEKNVNTGHMDQRVIVWL
jgi:hypothetical protein